MLRHRGFDSLFLPGGASSFYSSFVFLECSRVIVCFYLLEGDLTD
jgi:hypothetical protein